MLHELATGRAERVALDDGERTRTWAEVADRATRLGRVIRDVWDVPPDGHLAMIVGNRVEFVEMVLASITSGVWVTPVSTHLTPPEIDHVVRDSGARVVVADADQVAAARNLTEGLPVVQVGAELDALISTAPDVPFAAGDHPGGTMFYTSGTTGRPKGVKRTRRADLGSHLAGLTAAGEALGLHGTGPHLVTGPMQHAAPLGFAVMDLLRGAPLVILPRFDAAAVLRSIDERQVHDTHLVPTMCVRLLALPEEQRAAFGGTSLRTVLHGAAPIAPTVKRAMIDWWGPVLVEYWGASEGGVVTLASSAEWLQRPGTVGRPLPSYEVVVTDEGGRLLPTGEVGRLWCRHRSGSAVFEYHLDAEKTAAAHLDPATYTIGDLGWVDDDGYVQLTDRVANTIISGGVNVYPAEVEGVLMEHPAVHDVAVLGVPDDEWGEVVKAVVQPVAGADPDAGGADESALGAGPRVGDELGDELRAFARSRLASYKVPRVVELVESLPRHDNGKLIIRDLRERHA